MKCVRLLKGTEQVNAAARRFRSGFVALVGLPNVGKSTLLNALLRRKLSIVTRKAQTTRRRILGIETAADAQIIFVDTPGVLMPRYKLQSSMMREVARAVSDADLVVMLIDATATHLDTLGLNQTAQCPTILALNKMDRTTKDKALPVAAWYAEQREFESVVPISALKGTNVDVLRREIVKRLPFGPAYFEADQISNLPERFFVAEIVREKLFERYWDEIPYATAVHVARYEAREAAKNFVEVDIVVERPTQKQILIGAKGGGLKAVGTVARRDIEAFLGKPVYLALNVKVRRDWRNRDELLRSYGY